MNDTSLIRDISSSESDFANTPVAYLDDAPEEILQLVIACFPQLRWERQSEAVAKFMAMSALPKRGFLAGRHPPAPAWHASLSPLDCLVYWDITAAPAMVTSSPAAVLLLSSGPFGREHADPLLTSRVNNLVLRPVNGKIDVPSLAGTSGTPVFWPTAFLDSAQVSPASRVGVAAIGAFSTALLAREVFPNGLITAMVSRPLTLDEQIQLAQLEVRIVSDSTAIAALISQSERIVTDVLEVALAARTIGLPTTPLGQATDAIRMTADVGQKQAITFDTNAFYGFTTLDNSSHLSHDDVTAQWLTKVGLPDDELTIDPPIDPGKLVSIVVGQPGRAVTPFSKHFGVGAWDRDPSIRIEALEWVADRFSHCDLLVYARDKSLPDWCRSSIGYAKRIFDRLPLDYPLSLSTAAINIPLFGCHRVVESGDGIVFNLADDIGEMSVVDRERHKSEGKRLLPLLKRLQTVRRIARLNKFDVAKKYGPLGTKSILILGSEEDLPPTLNTNSGGAKDIDVLSAALTAHPYSRVLYLPQKKALADAKHVQSCRALDKRVVIVDPPLSVSELAHVVSEVYTIDSQLGLFALTEGLPLTVYGQPFYSDLGVTYDLEASGEQRKSRLKSPLDLETFIGWYFRTCAKFADALSGEPIDIDEFLTFWTPYLGELDDAIADRIVEEALNPDAKPGDIQQLLRTLTGHAKADQIQRLVEALDPGALITKSAGLALDVASAIARSGDWRQAVIRSHGVWQKHGTASVEMVSTTLVKIRSLINSIDEVEDFDHFLLATFRSMPGKDVETLGNQFLTKHYFETAQTLFRSCPSSRSLIVAQARCHIGIGNTAAAEGLIGQLVSLKEEPAVVENLRLALFERTGDLEQVIAIVKKQVAGDTGNYPLKLRLVNYLRDAGQLNAAVDMLLPLVRSSQGQTAMRTLAGIYISQMKTSKARGLLEAYLNLTPTDATCWKLLGQVHSFENRMDEACNCLFVALTLSPLDIATHTLLTEFESEMARGTTDDRRWTRAFDELLTTVDQCSNETLLAQGRANLQVHDFACLKDNCKTAMRLFPDDTRAHAWYAHALAWEMSEKTLEILADIRRHYGLALAREKGDNSFTILDAIRSLSKVEDIDGIRNLVRHYHKPLYISDRERMVVPRYSAALALGDYLTAFDAMRDFLRGKILRRNAQSFRLARSIDDVGWRDSVLLLSEGGVGDELRYATLYPELIARIPDATISVDERLFTLFERSFPMVKRFVPLPRYHRKRLNKRNLNSIGDLPDRELAPFADDRVWKIANQADIVLPVPCALADLRKTEADFRKSDSVKLLPRPDLVAYWRERLEPYADRLIVGATWTSMFREYQRVENYLTHEEMTPLFKIPGTVFVNCQYENIDEELAWAKNNLGVEILDFPELDKRDDFEGLAGLLTALDLFVGVGTTTTEYAALLGCKTIFASPICLNAYRNPTGTEIDLYFRNAHFIRPVPATDRRQMIGRIEELIIEEVKRKASTPARLHAKPMSSTSKEPKVIQTTTMPPTAPGSVAGTPIIAT